MSTARPALRCVRDAGSPQPERKLSSDGHQPRALAATLRISRAALRRLMHDLERLSETEVEQDAKRYILRNTAPGCAGIVLRTLRRVFGRCRGVGGGWAQRIRGGRATPRDKLPISEC